MKRKVPNIWNAATALLNWETGRSGHYTSSRGMLSCSSKALISSFKRRHLQLSLQATHPFKQFGYVPSHTVSNDSQPNTANTEADVYYCVITLVNVQLLFRSRLVTWSSAIWSYLRVIKSRSYFYGVINANLCMCTGGIFFTVVTCSYLRVQGK